LTSAKGHISLCIKGNYQESEKVIYGAGRVAQVVEHMPTKLKALSSNPHYSKEGEEKKYQKLDLDLDS
jgi:hypothetical protein